MERILKMQWGSKCKSKGAKQEVISPSLKSAQNKKLRPVYYCSFKSFRSESGLSFGISALFMPKNAKINFGQNPANF